MKNTKQGVGIAVLAGLMALTVFWAAAQVASLGQSSKPQAVPLEKLPPYGTFLSLQRSNQPPLPMNPLSLPIELPRDLTAYVIAPGVYAVEDRLVDYKKLELLAQVKQLEADLAAVEAGEMTLQSLLEGESGGGGMMSLMSMPTNCGTGEDLALMNMAAVRQTNSLMTVSFDLRGGWAGTNYHVMRTSSLEGGSFTNLTVWWCGAFQACDHVTLTNQPDGNAFYFAVDELADLDADSLPDFWEMKHFGSLSYGPADDQDQDGVSNADEYAAGSDPNSIVFTAHFPTAYVNSNSVPFTIQLLSGVPTSLAVLVDSTNFASAQWVAYSSNALAYLGTTDGRKDVRIGLRGRNADSQKSWELNWVTRDTVPPLIVLTNPVASSGSRPIIQVQGYANEALSLITFNVTNATGILADQQGFVTGQEFNTNTFSFTTNYFQCFDVPLGTGTNTISIRLTDLAGNVATTNRAYTLAFAGDTNAPVLAVAWPPNGAAIGGDQFNLRGTLDDDTAQISAAIVGSSGVTNIVTGLVGRDGQYWIDALPLEAGTNNLILTTTDAAGNAITTNMTVVCSPASLTINPVSASEVNQAGVTVSGTVSGPTNYSVTVNGVLATDLGGGFWTATGVPSWGGGVASFNASACPAGGGACVLQSLEVERPPYYAIVDYQQSRNTAFTNSDGTGFSLTVLKQWSGKVVEASSNSWQLLHQGTTRYHNYSYTFATHTDTHYWWSNTNEGGSFVRVVESIPPDGQTTTNTGQGGLASPGGNVIPSAYLDWLDENVTIIHSFFDVDYEWDYPGGGKLTHTHFSKSRMELRTGGKPRSTRSSLFLLHVEGTDYGRPAWIAHGLIWAGTPNEDIPGDKLRVLGKPVGADGNLYLTLPDNAVLDGTATAATGSKSYYVGATAVKYTPRIYRGSNNVTDKTTSVIVGQKISLNCVLESSDGSTPPPITNFQWAIPGYAISNYIADVNSATVYTNFLTTTNSVDFYWVDGGNKQVSCTMKAVGQELTTTAEFSILRPQVTWMLTPKDHVAVDTNYVGYPIGYYYLRTGSNRTTNDVGIYYSFRATDNYNYGFNWNFQFVQLATIDWKENLDLAPMITNHLSHFILARGVDSPSAFSTYIYELWFSKSGYTTDTPATKLLSSAAFEWRSDSFESYLMFQPGNGIPVPLKVATWNWSGRAEKMDTNAPPAFRGITPFTDQQASIGTDTLSFPQWTNNLPNLKTQWTLSPFGWYPTP